MSGADNILEGCVEVAIKNIDNDGYIWVSRLPCPKLEFQKNELDDYNSLEIKCERIKHRNVSPIVGERYAVSLSNNCFVRCEIVLLYSRKSKVFLIDQGRHEFVLNELIFPLPEKLKCIPALAYRLSFYGIQPLSVQLDELLMFTKKKCERWQTYHVNYMKENFDEAKKVYFKEINKLKGVSFGIIIVQGTNNEIINLNNELCEKGWAEKSENFEEFSKRVLRFSDDENKETKSKTVSQILNTSGILGKTSRECLLKAAFGDKASKNDLSVQHCKTVKIDDNLDITPSTSGSGRYFSSDCQLVNLNSAKNLNKNNFAYETVVDKNIVTGCTTEPLEGKPVDPHVLMLYEKFQKFSNLKNFSIASESSNYESEEDNRELKKKSPRKLYSGALLHQSSCITEEIEPSERLIDSNINENIHKILEIRQRKDLTQLQKYAYPIVTKHYNLVMVSNPHSGKTLSSIVAILSLLNEPEYYSSFSKGYGPKAIFLTSFSQNVRTIEKICRILLSMQSNIVVKSAYGGNAVETRKCDLAAGCDILITTPRCLIRLLRARFVTNIERLCHIIFDDGDFIFNHFLPEIQELMKLIKILEDKRKQEKYFKKVQKIVLTEKWFPILENFVKEVMKDGFICIPMNNMSEAAVYSQVKPNIQFLKPESKFNAVIDLIKGGKGNIRTVIVTKNEEETLELQKRLDPICGRLLIAHEGMDHVTVSSIKSAWLEDVDGIHAVMICTDDVIFELTITNADHLIHFSLPATKTQFSCRYVCLLGKYSNFFTNELTSSCKVNLFVDEESDEQFPEIVSLMERLKYPIPEKIQNVVMRINLQKERSKKEKVLCENFKQFGTCWKIGKCHYRHIILPEVDDVPGLPKTGYVKLKVLEIHDASHFSVILLEHKVGQQWRKLAGVDQLAIINLQMECYFENEDNRCLHIKPKIGDMVAVEMKNGYQRAFIIEFVKFDDKRKPTDVKVKLLETGEVTNFKCYNLYHLPEDLKKEPPQAVDVYLCKLQPTDLDKYWSYPANNLIQACCNKAEVAMDHFGENHYLCGRILLGIGRNLWLDPLTYSEWLESTKAEIYHCSFRHDLIKQNLAVEKSDHLELLYKQCKSAGLKIPKLAGLPVKKEESVSGQWAHINRNEFTEVCLVSAKSPEQLFLTLPKFEDRLDELQKDISKMEKKQLLKKGDINIGELCLALYPKDKTWNRAKILSFPSEDKVEVFYADHGDFEVLLWDQLAKIPVDLIKKLPLQAVECRLAGVQPLKENGWSDSSVSLLYSLSEIEEGLWKVLLAYAFDLELKANITGGRKYIITLLDVKQDPIILLNKELVIHAEANWQTEEKEWLDCICNEYNKFSNINEKEEIVDREEDWDYKVNDNNNNNNNKVTGLNKSSRNTYETDLNTPSSIIDEQLKRLYEAIQDEDNIEIGNASELLGDMFKIPIPGVIKNRKEIISIPSTPKNKLPALMPPEQNSSLVKLAERYEKFIKNKVPNIKELLRSNLPVVKDDNELQKPLSIINKRCSLTESERCSTTPDISDVSELEDFQARDCPPPLKQIGNCHTPLVYWYQNSQYIWLQIKLINVQNYYFKWSIRTLSFSTWLEEKYYRLDFNLFGPIYPETLQHSAKGFYVQIKMRKVLAGVNWSRLLQTKARYNWLKVNPEHVDGISDDSDDKAKSDKRRCMGRIDKNLQFFKPRPAGLSDTESEFSSDISDLEEVDPDDPFNVNAPAESD